LFNFTCIADDEQAETQSAVTPNTRQKGTRYLWLLPTTAPQNATIRSDPAACLHRRLSVINKTSACLQKKPDLR